VVPLVLVVAIRVVDGLDAAIEHIRRHGSGLAEAIVTSDLRNSRRFTREVDAAAVLVNASTRLVDGSQFGMGAEMGISTSRLHARGPVGVRELTTTKFVLIGDGHALDHLKLAREANLMLVAPATADFLARAGFQGRAVVGRLRLLGEK